MKLSTTLCISSVATVTAFATAEEPQHLLEFSPGETKWVPEAKKWEYLKAGKKFMDITNSQDLVNVEAAAPDYPSSVSHQDKIKPLFDQLNKDNMKDHLTTFSKFNNRYYKADTGRQSSEWLQKNLNDTITEASGNLSAASGITVEAFDHSWVQSSVIVTIPGKTENTVIVSAHQDSINQNLPATGRAPGADDDGSGVVTIWEAMRVLLADQTVLNGGATNTVEFHFYAAEEGGLLGSQDIFKSYKSEGRSVVGMFHQDMTGYPNGTLDAGKPECIGIGTDYVDAGLVTFLTKVIDAYCDIGYEKFKCGYACSDHASANKLGYPAAIASESTIEDSNPRLHTPQDKLKFIDYDHMLQHVRMTLGIAYELAFADLA